jgi:hypothetical protein
MDPSAFSEVLPLPASFDGVKENGTLLAVAVPGFLGNRRRFGSFRAACGMLLRLLLRTQGGGEVPAMATERKDEEQVERTSVCYVCAMPVLQEERHSQRTFFVPWEVFLQSSPVLGNIKRCPSCGCSKMEGRRRERR